MKCSAPRCPNDSSIPVKRVSYHGFPKNVEICNEWIKFVGKPGFVPKTNSRICSAHFKKSDYMTSLKLNSNAVPSLLPISRSVGSVVQARQEIRTAGLSRAEFVGLYCTKGEPARITHQSAQSSFDDPLACILGSNTTINDVKLVKEINITTGSTLSVTGVSSTKISAKTYAAQNENQNAVPTKTLVEVPSQVSKYTGQSQSELISNPPKDIKKCPIKVVDMKKLLMKKILESSPEQASNSESQATEQLGQFVEGKQKGSFSFKQNTTILGRKEKNHVNKYPKEKKFSNKRNGPFDTSQITVFHILECLKVILPNKFDLARLVPNEKVASLIIRYYKLKDDEVGRNLVVTTLKLVINGIRLKEKVFEGNLSTHPYLLISDEAIEAVLSYTLPINFSLADVSKEVLRCMCQLLKQEIFSDGYQILLNRVLKYSTDPNIIIKDFPKKNVNNKNTKKIVYRESRESILSDVVQNIRSESSLTSVDTSQYPSVKTEIDSDSSTDNDFRNTLPEDGNDVNDDQHDMDWTPDTEPKDLDVDQEDIDEDYEDVDKDNEWTPEIKPKKTTKPLSKKQTTPAHKFINLENVLQYLELKKCPAKDVPGNFKLMFNLCKHLHVRPKKVNVKKIESLLKVIMEGKHKTSSELEGDAKLKLKPIVIMHNLADYSKEKMLFMRSEENYHTFNGYCNNSFRNVLGQMKPAEKYTDDQVKKLTGGCYKLFRKIIMKKNGATVVFRLKYTRLTRGCVVFVRDFRSSSRGWLRGTVNKRLGAFNYSVTLDSGEIRHYLPEQLRPIIQQNNALPVNGVTKLTSRRNRPIKVKQLLDL